MHILKFFAENIKKLRVVEITPTGNLVQITGRNSAGKSSVLDAIFYALAGTKNIPSQPVRKGARKAMVKLDLGDVVVTRRFTEGGGSSLAVEGLDGSKFPSPQSMLDSLLGELAFDPLAFAQMESKAQLETLRRMVPLSVDIDALDDRRQTPHALGAEQRCGVRQHQGLLRTGHHAARAALPRADNQQVRAHG